MKYACGFWLPDNDDHFAQFGPTYQSKIRNAALDYVDNWSLAVDVGAHCGLWSCDLARRFVTIAAFEPQKENLECLERNIPFNVCVYPVALGDRASMGILKNQAPSNSGAWELLPVAADGNIHVRTLDSFALPMGLLKIDVQGSEERVLRGAEKTLKEYSPVVVVEDNGTGAIGYLLSLGYEERARVRRDVVLTK